MPTVRTSRPGEGEEEAVPGRPVVDPGAIEVRRITSNLDLADHVGRFVAGEVVTQFQNEDLADVLKGRNAIMISGSWG